MSPVDDWFLFPQAWLAASIRPRCVHALFLSAGQPATTVVPSGGRGCFCLTRWIGFVATVVLGMLLAAESARAASVRIRLEVTDLGSNVVANVNVGESFLLRGFVTDLRADPKGVFSSYLDVGYSPAAAVIPTGEVTFIAPFIYGPSADLSSAGSIANLGSFSGLSPTGGGERPQFNVRMQARAPGLVTFTGSRYAVHLYGLNPPVPADELQFVGTTIVVNEAALRIDRIEVGTNGAHLTLTGPPHATLQVQTLTHLTNGWQNVGSAVSLGAAGTAELLDASATNHPIRFYRAYLP